MKSSHKLVLPPCRERKYQARIQKWGLDKKLKAQEVAYALRKIQSRRNVRKETEIIIRGVVHSEDRLKKYAQRTKVVPEEDGSTPSAVIARTPPPEGVSISPIISSPATPASYASQLTTDVTIRPTRSVDSETPSVKKRPLSSPPENRSGSRTPISSQESPATGALSAHSAALSGSTLSLPNNPISPRASWFSTVLRQINEYHDEYFMSHPWEPLEEDEPGFDERPCSIFRSSEPVHYFGMPLYLCSQADPASIVYSVKIACQLFRSGEFVLGRCRLDQANCHIKILLLEQVPPLLACLLTAVCLLDSLRADIRLEADRPDPLTLFLEFVSQMAETKLRSHHPITKLFSSLVNMRTDHYYVAQMALHKMVDIYRARFGILHPYHCRLAHNSAWVLIWGRRFDEAGAALEQLLNKIELCTDCDNRHSRISRYLLAQVNLALHNISGADECFDTIITRARKGLGEDRAHFVTFEAWRMLAVIADFNQDFDERRRCEQEALRSGAMLLGPQHPRILKLHREMSGLATRQPAQKQWRFIDSFPPFGEEDLGTLSLSV
jgi:hypothetical protein